MKLIIHAGREKTGTSTIQAFLWENRERLREQGICYPNIDYPEVGPGCKGRTKIDSHFVAFCAERDSRGLIVPQDPNSKTASDVWRSMLDEAHGCDTMLLSSEQVDELAPSDVKRLVKANWFQVEDVTIVVYVRRQSEYLEAWYATSVRGAGWRGSVGQMVSDAMSKTTNRDLDLQKLCEEWEDAFPGRLIVRPFDKDHWPNGNLISDFCSTCGIDLQAGMVLPSHQNKRDDADWVRFLELCFETGWGFENQRRLWNIFGTDMQNLLEATCESRNRLTVEQRKRIDWLYEESNRAVARKYLGRDSLFGEADYHKRPSGFKELSTARLAQIVGGMMLIMATRQEMLAQLVGQVSEKLENMGA